MSDLEFTRGDTKKIKFQIKDANGNILRQLNSTNEEIYFTVKKSRNDEQFKFQKRYSEGDITYSDNYYHIVIQSSDTEDLAYGTYLYDIEIKTDEFTKTIALGSVTLTDEITHKGNEV